MSSAIRRLRSDPQGGWLWLLGVAALAFGVRLLTLVRGSGLYGRLGYDGPVYYASASALAHGMLPYRDFLLLHPPGIALALLPFAALGGIVGDSDAFALARVAWCGLGAVSTALVFVIVRSRGLWPALAAATFYAIFVPSVSGEDITTLEAIGSVCLLAAAALLVRQWDGRATSTAALVCAGVLLGVSTATKIWGVLIVVVLVAWSVRRVGRRAGWVLAGAVGATVAVCLPFFLAAPEAMWRMVVFDQLGRRRVSETLGGRVVDLVGLSGLRDRVSTEVLAVVALLLLGAAVVLAVRGPLGRFATLLLAVTWALLLWTPPWSLAYTALSAPAIALVFGCAVAELPAVSRRWHPAANLVVGGILVVYATVSLPGLPSGSHFPSKRLEQVFHKAPGCVTTDDPIVLIETGALQRNFALHCPVVVDLSGYSWDLQPSAGRHLSRQRNGQWQSLALDHLGSGDVSVVIRFRKLAGLSDETTTVISSWPLLAEISGLAVRHPHPRTTSPFR